MLGAAEALLKQPETKLSVATVSTFVIKLTHLKGEKIDYWVLPYGKGNIVRNDEYGRLWLEVKKSFCPDIIHLHGTEYSHGLAYIEACGANNVCVSIQGLTSAYEYYYSGLSRSEILKSLTPYSIINGGIMSGYRMFQKRGECEVEILRKVSHVIGRTTWDHDRVWVINPGANYHFCSETLRDDFYNGTLWDYKHCVPHSVFLSQASVPLKGLHQVLRAMPLILRHYPDATLRIAGNIICCDKGWISRMKLSNYGNLIRKIIKNNKLEDNIHFTGFLDGEGMRQEYMKCNVFVCPSSIENSPNSIGEAQILGVPVLASYVGGIPDMMRGDEEHLYRFEEVQMLAAKICRIFEAQSYQPQVDKMREIALVRHNPDTNSTRLLEIYRNVLNQPQQF